MSGDDTRVELDFPIGVEDIGCKQCKSPFHETKDCPQSKTGEPRFQFRSRKEMGLEPGSLPFKFRVEIDGTADDEVEVTRKRALLRLNSAKVYKLMGVSVKAHESQKTALVWMARMLDELDIDDDQLQEERRQLVPLVVSMQEVMRRLVVIRQIKIHQAEAMEELVTTARRKASQVRKRIEHTELKKLQQNNDFFILPMPDTGVDMPMMGDQDPLELIKEATDAILAKEKADESFDNDDESV